MALGSLLPLTGEHPEIPNLLTIIGGSEATQGIAQTPFFNPARKLSNGAVK